MGLITQVLNMLVGRDSGSLREIVEIFRVNAEQAAQRGHTADAAALDQFAAEFAARANRTWWDSFWDGLNRAPRPLMALWVIWVLAWTPVDPVFMAQVFEAWSIIPQSIWAIILLVVTFFFGGRQQVKDIEFKRDMAGMLGQAQAIAAQHAAPGAGDTAAEMEDPATDNPALAAILERER